MGVNAYLQKGEEYIDFGRSYHVFGYDSPMDYSLEALEGHARELENDIVKWQSDIKIISSYCPHDIEDAGKKQEELDGLIEHLGELVSSLVLVRVMINNFAENGRKVVVE